MSFTMRTSKPGAGNKYYIRKANGGYSNAIAGSPKDSECNVLANCVGYAYGRFNEIGGYGYCKYLAPVNAENFMSYKGSCSVGQTPKVGACMVWQKGATLSGSDGAGHVAIVEKVISDTEVYTSESGYGASKPFWNSTRKKGSDGRWGCGSAYKFLGFIYNPAIVDETPTSTLKSIAEIAAEVIKGNWGNGTERVSRLTAAGYDATAVQAKVNELCGVKTTNKVTAEWKPAVGDTVVYNGKVHYSNANATSGPSCKGGKATITAIYRLGQSKHPYHLKRVSGSGATVYGWVDAGTFTKA